MGEPTPYRRHSDPEGFDPLPLRTVDPAQWELQLGFKGATVSIRGIAVLMLLALALGVASNLWAGYRIEQSTAHGLQEITDAVQQAVKFSSAEHRDLMLAQERVACAAMMSTDDKQRFRNDYRDGAWQKWCPWIKG